MQALVLGQQCWASPPHSLGTESRLTDAMLPDMLPPFEVYSWDLGCVRALTKGPKDLQKKWKLEKSPSHSHAQSRSCYSPRVVPTTIPSLPPHGFMNVMPRCVMLLLVDVNLSLCEKEPTDVQEATLQASMALHGLVCTIFVVGRYLSQCSQYVGFRGALAIIQTRAGNDANTCADPPGWGSSGQWWGARAARQYPLTGAA